MSKNSLKWFDLKHGCIKVGIEWTRKLRARLERFLIILERDNPEWDHEEVIALMLIK